MTGCRIRSARPSVPWAPAQQLPMGCMGTPAWGLGPRQVRRPHWGMDHRQGMPPRLFWQGARYPSTAHLVRCTQQICILQAARSRPHASSLLLILLSRRI